MRYSAKDYSAHSAEEYSAERSRLKVIGFYYARQHDGRDITIKCDGCGREVTVTNTSRCQARNHLAEFQAGWLHLLLRDPTIDLCPDCANR